MSQISREILEVTFFPSVRIKTPEMIEKNK